MRGRLAIVVCGAAALSCASVRRPAPALALGGGALAGTWDVAQAGVPLGTESVSIAGAAWTSKVSLPSAGVEFVTRTEYADGLEPRRYRLEGRPARREAQVSFEVDRPGHGFVASAQGGEQTNVALSWDGPAVILDNNVVAHWAALAKRWQGKPMKLAAIVPQDATVTEVTVERGEDAPPDGDALRATLRGVEVRLVLDKEGNLEVLSIPSLALRAVRRGAGAEYLRAFARGAGRIAPEPPPPPAPPEREVTIPSGGLFLYGTLALPAGHPRPPVALFVHGAGPMDRDETMGGTRIFKDLARELAAQGVASLRYDKVTYTYRNPPGRPMSRMTLAEEAEDDVKAALAYLRASPDVDGSRVALVAYAQGGVVACGVAASDPSVGALVLLAAPAERPDEALLRQVRFRAAREGRPKRAVEEELDTLRAELARVKSGNAPPGEMVEGAPAGYWKDWLARDPLALAAAVAQPALLVQGGKDWQVPPDAQDALAAARQRAGRVTERALVPEANHLLVRVEGVSDGSEYAQPAHVCAPARQAVAGFLSRALHAK